MPSSSSRNWFQTTLYNLFCEDVSSRRKTSDILEFEFYKEGRPHVNYEFIPSTTNSVTLIKIPHRSDWSCGTHFHFLPNSCETISLSAGEIALFQEPSKAFPTDKHTDVKSREPVTVKVGQHVNWQPFMTSHKMDLEVSLTYTSRGSVMTEKFQRVDEKMMQFYHTVASVYYDHERFCTLKSTSRFIKYPYSISPPVIQHAMNAFFLIVQLRVVYYQNDYWVWSGSTPGLSWFLGSVLGHSQERIAISRANSEEFWAGMVMWLCWFVGRWFFGMRAEYSVYNVNFLDLQGMVGGIAIGHYE